MNTNKYYTIDTSKLYIINKDNTITYIKDLQSMTYCHQYDIMTYSAMTS